MTLPDPVADQDQSDPTVSEVPPSGSSTPPSRWWKKLLVLLLGCIVLLFGVVAWGVATSSGLRFIAMVAEKVSPGKLQIGQTQGSVLSGFTLQDIRWQGQDAKLKLDKVRLAWFPEKLIHRQLHISRLELGDIEWTQTGPGSSTPLAVPTSLALPVQVKLDELTLNSISLLPSDVRLYGIQASYVFDSKAHTLRVARLESPWGKGNGQFQLGAMRPFAIKGRLVADGVLQGVPVSGAFQLDQTLLDLHAQGDVNGKGILAHVDTQLHPFAASALNRFSQADIRIAGVNPRAILPQWPQGNVSLALHAAPASSKTIQGGVTFINREAGPVSAQAIPLKLLTASFAIQGQQLTLQQLKADIAGGSWIASGKLDNQGMDISSTLSEIQLQQIHASAPDKSVKGTLHVFGAYSTPQVEAVLSSAGVQLSTLLRYEATPRHPVLSLQKLQVSAGQGKADVRGVFQLSSPYRYRVNGNFSHFNPAMLKPALPRGDINADLQAEGVLSAPYDASLMMAIAKSQLSGHPLNGKLNVTYSKQHLNNIDAHLQLANNILDAKGAYGQPGDKLKLILDAPNLGLLGPAFGGTIKGSIDVAGVAHNAIVDVDLTAKQLQVPGGVSAQLVQLQGRLRPDPASPFNVKTTIQSLRVAQNSVEQLKASIDGSRAKHVMALEADVKLANKPFHLEMAASGGLKANEWQWQGVLGRLLVRGKPDITLLTPVSVEAGSKGVKFANAKIATLGGVIQINDFSRLPSGQMSSHGSASQLKLSDVVDSKNEQLRQMLASLVFEANWGLSLANGVPTGIIRVRKTAGDISTTVNEEVLELGASQAEAEVQWQSGRVSLNSRLTTRFGKAAAQVSMPWSEHGVDQRAPLSGSVTMSVPELKVIAPFVSPSLELGGNLDMALTLNGLLSMPQWSGRIQGGNLLLADHRTGLRLEQGNLQARMDGRRLIVDQLVFSGGKGELQASGTLDLKDDLPDANIKVSLKQFSVFDKANRRLVVSGISNLTFIDKKLTLVGRIRADQGRIELPKAGTPSLGDDVVIKGQKPAEPSAFANLPIFVALDLDLGNNFRFTGQGLDVELAGIVRVTATQGHAPAAVGQVNIVKGRYKAYGQDLDIEKGVITFTGPLDNPSLTIRAVRRLSPVGAGVEVLGTVSAPRIQLISEDTLTDRDKLAWLVLGHAASTETDNNTLAASAGMMLAGSLTDKLGVFDDVGLTSRKEKTLANGTVSAAEQVVTVGRQLSKEFYLGYEYGMTSAQKAVKMAYQLGRGWSVILRAGTESSVESRYTIRFD